MSKTLLIYERAVPINKERHGNWGVNISNDFSFAKKVNSLPLLAQEFRHAAAEYPIVFAGTKEQLMPVVLLGVRESENLYINDSGEWKAKYIPAFARRYPYIFSSNDGGKTLTLCIDEEYKGFNQDGEGERLFTDEGEQTPYIDGVLEFQKDYQRFFQRTLAFCKRLQELDLLEPMQAQLKLQSGEEIKLGGFMAVNREQLKQLPAEKLSELSMVDELELIYLHMHSMLNVSELASRFNTNPDASSNGDVQVDATSKTKSTDSGEKGSQASVSKKKSATAKKKAATSKTAGNGSKKPK